MNPNMDNHPQFVFCRCVLHASAAFLLSTGQLHWAPLAHAAHATAHATARRRGWWSGREVGDHSVGGEHLTDAFGGRRRVPSREWEVPSQLQRLSSASFGVQNWREYKLEGGHSRRDV